MSLPRFSVQRPVTTVMIYAGVILLGVIAWTRLPQELYPPITYPQLTVATHYRDAAPEEIELLITKPIEEVVGTVSGLRRVSSISKEELSLVIAEFNWGTHMDFAALGVREKIDLIKERLPRGSEDPVVIKFNPFELPVLVLNVSGALPPYELLEVARKQIKNELEKAEGVAAVNVSGGLEREILVEVDQARLQASGLPVARVVDALSQANLNYPAGTIKEAFYEYLIRTMGEFQLVPEIGSIAVHVEEERKRGAASESPSDQPGPLRREKGSSPGQRMILLQEVAQVKDTFKERSSISRYNGRENISLRVQKQAGANTVSVAARIKQLIERLKPGLPPQVSLTVAYDQSTFIRNAISGVSSAALQGGALAFLVLYLFLGNPWAALNVAFAIPICILSTIALMYFSGVTINVISLGGLALGIGLLVDAGIVVVDSIDRLRSQGKNPQAAAIEGTELVAGAIFGTVLTTIVVFLPMIFVVGIAGQLFKELAYTVTFSNLGSLVVSMSLTALFASLLKPTANRSPIEGLLQRFSQGTAFIVGWFLRHRFLGISAVVVLFSVSLMGLKGLDRELLPRVDQGQFILRVDLPPGTRLEVSDRVSLRIEQVLRAIPEVQDVTVTIGSSKEKKAEELLETLGSHQAQILVNLKSRPARTRKTADIVQELKETLGREPLEAAEVEYLLQESVFKTAFLGGAPVVIEIKGTQLPLVEQLARSVEKELKEISGLYGVQTSLIPPSPEVKVHVMKDRAAAYHLSVSDIALTSQTALKGYLATKFKQEGKEIDVRVQLRKQDREDLSKVRRLFIHSPLDIDVPLAEVAFFTKGKGPTEIRHLDQQRTVLVSAQLFKRSLQEVLQEVDQRLRNLGIPRGYSVSLTGENQEMRESFQSLIFALVLSVILVYMVMASEFESLWQPFLIMGTIPMSLIGVVAGLWATGTPISVMVGLGFITLGGIVVDNGIVLIEYVNLLRRRGMALEEAVIEASRTHMRPVLMTSATTVLGVLPLALGWGQGVELQGPMAIAVMWGLTISTFLTLIFLPALYVVGAHFFERFHPFAVTPPLPAAEPALALAGAPERLVPLPPAAAGAPAAVELPDIPKNFGGEEVPSAPEKSEFPFFFPNESLTWPEPPPPSLAEPVFEEPQPTPETPATPEEQPPAPALIPPRPEVPLSSRQKELLAHLQEHGRITRKEHSDKTGISIPTAARDLKELVDRGLIQGMGPLGPGRYYVPRPSSSGAVQEPGL